MMANEEANKAKTPGITILMKMVRTKVSAQKNSVQIPFERNQHETYDTAGDITKKIKMEVPDFEGKVNSTLFHDWLASIEEYFDWYDMADDRRVRFAKMKLVGLAKIWWMGVEGDIRRLGQPPIGTWQEMKAKLREKYMPSNYHEKLCKQLIELKQNNVSAAEYMQKFDELKMRSQVTEDSSQTLARFKAGLRPDIRRELLRQPLYSLEHAFQVALDMEEYLKYPIPKKFGSQVGEIAAKGYNDASRFWPSVSKQTSANTADPKGKNHAANKEGGKDNRCFKCGETGHMAYQCPKRNLHMGMEQEAEFDQQHNDDNDDSFDIGVLNTDDLEEEEVDNSLISVVRRILTAPKVEKEDWRRTSIFQMLVLSGNQAQKLIIDGGSCMNVVSAATVERLKLLFNHILIRISDSIWCDVIPMNVTHILLGRPLLYDRDVQHCGKENTYAFSFKNKEIVLKPMNTTEMEKYKEKKPKGVAENKPKSLHIRTKKCFQIESMELGVIYAVVVNEVSESAAATASELPSEVAELLSHFSNVAPKELPNELPLMRNVQHAIDLIPGSQLPNLPAYHMNPSEHAELKRQEYSFVIKHKAGSENKVADALSQVVYVLSSVAIQVVGFDLLKSDYPSSKDFSSIQAQLLAGQQGGYDLQDAALLKLSQRFAEFDEGDMVMVRVKPEQYPKGVYKKLHSKSAGPFKALKKISSNAYVLELPDDTGISNVFNIEDLTRHSGHVEDTNRADPVASLPASKRFEDEIEDVVNNQIISTRHGGYQKYLIKWKGRSLSDC
ncbi:hypothetical protein RHSIM_Rhsim03G0243100 [Rhododendron simsii]|uniref:CCHC-type domain-containing protein n=1 Tax=Rhododendron simsii TaxID=118357 RepID=A0A834HH09_RHOSS|nr:hypothetical protein RHSIM_Rhsim03G0243100 [Rhododendron simsii]